MGCFHRHPAGCREFSGFDEQMTLYLYTVVALLLERGHIRQVIFHDRKVSADTGNKDRFGPCYHPGFRLDKGLLKAVAKNRVNGFYEIRGTNAHVMTLKLDRYGKPKVVEMPWITECIEMLLAEGCFAVLMMDRHTAFDEVPLAEQSFFSLWEGIKEYLGRKFALGWEYTLGSTKVLSLYPKRPQGLLARYQYRGSFGRKGVEGKEKRSGFLPPSPKVPAPERGKKSQAFPFRGEKRDNPTAPRVKAC